jgi:hypothetical protein
MRRGVLAFAVFVITVPMVAHAKRATEAISPAMGPKACLAVRST